ncbi:hypothetical protein ACJX0J_021157, partial [Zea mays]
MHILHFINISFFMFLLCKQMNSKSYKELIDYTLNKNVHINKNGFMQIEKYLDKEFMYYFEIHILKFEKGQMNKNRIWWLLLNFVIRETFLENVLPITCDFLFGIQKTSIQILFAQVVGEEWIFFDIVSSPKAILKVMQFHIEASSMIWDTIKFGSYTEISIIHISTHPSCLVVVVSGTNQLSFLLHDLFLAVVVSGTNQSAHYFEGYYCMQSLISRETHVIK